MPIEIGYGLGLRMNYFQTGREVMGFVLADARVQNFVLVYDGRAISVYRNADKQELSFTLPCNCPDGPVGNW